MSQIDRPLSYTEELFFWRTKLKGYSNFRVAGEYSVDLNPQNVFQALKTMLYQYSPLTTGIVPDKTQKLGYRVSLLSRVMFSDVVEFVEDESLNTNISKILDRYHTMYFNFDDCTPLWKLKIINEKYVLVFFDHTFFDGTSGKNFHIEFSNALAEQKTTESGPSEGMDTVLFDRSLTDPEKYQIFPPPKDIIDYNGSIITQLKSVFEAVAPKPITNWLKYWFGGNPYAGQMTYHPILGKDIRLFPNDKDSSPRNVFLNAEDVNKLIQLTRAHNVKMTSLVVLLAHLSISNFIVDSRDSLTSVPVNVRSEIDIEKAERLCPTFSDKFGIYMSGLDIELPAILKVCPEREINWDVVEYIHARIHKKSKSSKYRFGPLQYADTKKFLVENIEKREKYTLEVSNVGMVSSCSPNLLYLWFDQPPESFGVNMASTVNGANFTLRTYNSSHIDEFADGFEKLLRRLLDE
ncbi:hypothetical protein CAS74_004823 [Pichia kudriavzevii]|uniref:N-acetyltransferase SLI1 n=1 Tax=Pichia kudriavzevii TaxID=4909 RepID=A0A099P8H7_PICKU|nr:hypothetical protein JL09_g147 [Pichia kudriavzevii]OUT20085.1 hypothetical protein CAS74_004823 [Pichia kudriavzevii]